MFVLILLCGVLTTVNADCEILTKREGVDVKCMNPNTNKEFDCYSSRLPVGTAVTYKCIQTFYIPIDNDGIRNGKMTCGAHRRWTALAQFKYFSCNVNCGIALANRPAVGFVIGGVETQISDFPWHASIYARRNASSSFVYICGGTLIKPYNKGFLVLTAAHCLADARVKPRDTDNVKVVLGAEYSTLEDNYEVDGAQIHNVRRIILHDSYEGESNDFQGDIALVALKKDVKLDLTVLPACFSQAIMKTNKGSEGDVVGFGRDEHNGQSVSVTLRRATLPVVDNDLCFEWRSRKLSPLEFCAGYLNSQSVCNGDSGGGLVFTEQFNGAKRYFVQGIVTHGKRDLDNRKETCDSYSVFTKVTSYADWIRKTAETLVSDDDRIDEEPEPKQKIRTTTIRYGPIVTTEDYATTRRPVFGNSNYEIPQQRPPRPSYPNSNAQTFPNSPNLPQSQQSYDQACLEHHNYYRRMHKAAPLRLNSNLKWRAQTYADKLIREGKFENENEKGINKNVYYIGGPQPTPERAVVLAVDSWYDEIESYNWNNPYYNTFSQIVWKSTTDIGTGVATDGRKTIVVTAYSPPGNILGEDGKYFKENVAPKS